MTVQALGALGPLPVLCGSLWSDRDDALATPTAVLDMVVCESCGHVWNSSFDPALVEYDAKYDNSLDHSPTFATYAQALVDRLVRDFSLQGRTIVEIGAGKGAFLQMLCAAGGNRGLGFDPTYEGPDVDGDVRFVRTFFAPETAPEEADFLCCRHVLEHLEDPHGFLVDVRSAVGGRAVPMYFEVPNAEFNFAETGPWDLIYPHVAYFSDASLHALFARAGFRVTRLEPAFSGQFLSIEVVPDDTEPMLRVNGRGRQLADSHQRAFDRQVSAAYEWRRRLDGMLLDGGVALWGAGSKGVTFLSLVDEDRTIGTVVDANPHKWGRFLPGSGHEVVSPDKFGSRSVPSVLVMNPAYESEIRGMLAARGSTPDIVFV